jgi:hypothetical protein
MWAMRIRDAFRSDLTSEDIESAETRQPSSRRRRAGRIAERSPEDEAMRLSLWPAFAPA